MHSVAGVELGQQPGTAWPWTTTGAWLVLATWAAVATALVVLPSNRCDR